MAVVVWLREGTWPACADAARDQLPADGRTVLLHVTDPETAETADAARAGLLGRAAPPGRDPAARIDRLAADLSRELLAAAGARVGRPCELRSVTGGPERAVTAAASGADLLICARDGDRGHPGPHSLGPATRFVVDHAECPVLLVWPDR
ncbi:universal stress protein [Streptomyces tsukubensis]|uniref:universal stress protein n=1 Tax=Streptomyces tsukubensis TaxID=83656 RepID=UPI0036C40820